MGSETGADSVVELQGSCPFDGRRPLAPKGRLGSPRGGPLAVGLHPEGMQSTALGQASQVALGVAPHGGLHWMGGRSPPSVQCTVGSPMQSNAPLDDPPRWPGVAHELPEGDPWLWGGYAPPSPLGALGRGWPSNPKGMPHPPCIACNARACEACA